MTFERRNLVFAATAVAALTLALAATGRADQVPGDAPNPAATSFGQSVVGPLREIGRVKARTAFCRAFLAHASTGVSSALDFEKVLLDTLSHFRNAQLDDELNKYKSIKQLERDLNRLTDLSLAGRSELEELKALDTDPARHQAMVDFVDALNGAKGRQMELARKLSNTLGTIAEAPVYTNVTLPGESDQSRGSSAFRGRGTMSPTSLATGNALDKRLDKQNFDLRNDLFDAMPGDELVGRDLRRAGDNGKLTLALGGC